MEGTTADEFGGDDQFDWQYHKSDGLEGLCDGRPKYLSDETQNTRQRNGRSEPREEQFIGKVELYNNAKITIDRKCKCYFGTAPYLKAIWTWTAHREVFEKAKKLLQVNRLAYFRKREGLPIGEPPLNEERLTLLKERLQSFFKEKKCGGEQCVIETFDRGEGRFCVVAYPDDLPVPYLENKHDELIPVMVNPVFEVVFEIDSNAGTLAVSAKFGNAVKEELENLFIRTVYGIEPPPLEKLTYNLEPFKNQRIRLVTEAADAVGVEISSVGIKWEGSKSVMYFYNTVDQTVYDAINELLRREKRTLEGAEVRRAVLKFHFYQRKGRRAGILCAEMTPTGVHFGSKDTNRTEVMQKYLTKWRFTR